MKKSNAILIIQLVCMYLMQVPLYIAIPFIRVPNADGRVAAVLFMIAFALLVLTAPVCILSFVFSCFHFVRNNASPLKTAMIVKLCLIPWYIFNFAICAVFVGGFLNPFLMVGIPILIALEVSVTYIFMLSTSVHSITYTVKYLVSHRIKPNAQMIVALVFHFIFGLDIVGAVMLSARKLNSPAAGEAAAQ